MIPRGRFILILGTVSALVLTILAFIFFQKSFAPSASLQVDSMPLSAQVFVDEKLVGETPYRGEFQGGEYTIKVADPERKDAFWQGKVTLSSGTLTVIERDLGPSEDFSAGVVLTLVRGRGLSVISNPSGAKVYLDGTDIGETPVTRPAPSEGARQLRLEAPGYLPKELTVNVTADWKLQVSVQLYKNPDFAVSFDSESNISSSGEEPKIVRRETSGLDKIATSSGEVAGGSYSKAQLFKIEGGEGLSIDPFNWLLGLAYHATAHLNLPSLPYHFLIDSTGAIYEGKSLEFSGIDPLGGLSQTAENPTLKPGLVLVGYLGETPTSVARDSFSSLARYLGKVGSANPQASAKVKILDTPTGFLRVRSGPGTGHAEVARVNPGETYEFLEEQSGWYKIRISPETDGWVSAQYASKI